VDLILSYIQKVTHVVVSQLWLFANIMRIVRKIAAQTGTNIDILPFER
jgi:hypothetical protein